MSDEREYILVVDDRLWKSVSRDIVSIVTLFAMVGVGYVLGSVALQWIGGLIWILWIIARVDAQRKKMTISQARKRLDELERQTNE